MKKLLVIIFFFFSSLILPQSDTVYYGLRGISNLDGNTILFYRLLSSYTDNITSKTNRDIYNYNVNAKKVNHYLADYSYRDPVWSSSVSVYDFELLNNDTSFVFISTTLGGFEPVPVVNINHDQNIEVDSFHGITGELEVVENDGDTIIYVSAVGNPSGIFSGQISDLKLDLLPGGENIRLLSICPFQLNLIFGLNEDGLLVNSTDHGLSFSPVIENTYFLSKEDAVNEMFFHDEDSNHVYFSLYNKTELQYEFYKGGSNGKPGTIEKSLSSRFPIFISNPSSKIIYTGSGQKILRSVDAGKTFSIFDSTDNRIRGLFVEPLTERIFATGKYRLFEITGDSVTILQGVKPNSQLSFYPLAIGNKWYYNFFMSEDNSSRLVTEEIIGDTLMPNGVHYFIRKISRHNSVRFERVDPVEGIVYEYLKNGIEQVQYSLVSEPGDTIVKISDGFSIVLEEEVKRTFFEKDYNVRVYSLPNILEHAQVSLIDSIGYGGMSINYYGTYVSEKLIGAKIGDVFFGDSVITGLNEPISTKPSAFTLSQNYPNPFNPTTKIIFSLTPPLSLRERASDLSGEVRRTKTEGRVRVSLKIYDILGREMATLINESKPPGTYDVEFDGSQLPSGVYFYRLNVGKYSEIKKMVLMR